MWWHFNGTEHIILKVHVPKTQWKGHLPPCKHKQHLVSACCCHSRLVHSVRWNIYKGEMFLIHLFLVLLQNRGRSSPLVRPCLIYCTLSHKKPNSPVDVADNHTIALWEVFLYLPSLSVLLCRWSHSYRNRSDVRVCGSGRDCALHREDDTVRKRIIFSRLSVTTFFDYQLFWIKRAICRNVLKLPLSSLISTSCLLADFSHCSTVKQLW